MKTPRRAFATLPWVKGRSPGRPYDFSTRENGPCAIVFEKKVRVIVF